MLPGAIEVARVSARPGVARNVGWVALVNAPVAVPEVVTVTADAAIAALKGGAPIYMGTLKDNQGNVVIDKEYDNYDPYLDGMNWLLEGVQGSIT